MWDKQVKNFSGCDIGWIKLASMAFILAVVKGVDILLDWNLLEEVSVWWFVGIFVVASIKPMVKMFGKGKQETPKPQLEDHEIEK